MGLTKSSPEILSVARQVFNDEISALELIRDSLSDGFVRAVELILACNGKVVVSGMGKSGHIGNKIAATLASTGTAAFFMHPAEALHGDLGMISGGDLVIAISYSGESDELNAILPLIKRKNVPVVSITGNSNSSLAQFSDCVIPIAVNKEACPLNLAPTTSTTATLVVGDALAVVLLSLRKFQPEDFALSHPGGSLGRKLLTRVADIMHSGNRLPLVKEDTTLKEVVVEISRKGLGMAVVVDDEYHVLGVVTDGDLRRVLDSDVDVRTLCAKNFMTLNPKVIHYNAMGVEAVSMLQEYRIGGLIAIDDNHVVVGAFNLQDLFQAKLI
ncbi:MAG: KpsF/GutQ family sugar-phosphate isomerase [Proteobacteria bacterium]|nr:MAG: KpsF/GutQ family sugar-phosphate isomerase [Pseudomonadota bacterium]